MPTSTQQRSFKKFGNNKTADATSTSTSAPTQTSTSTSNVAAATAASSSSSTSNHEFFEQKASGDKSLHLDKVKSARRKQIRTLQKEKIKQLVNKSRKQPDSSLRPTPKEPVVPTFAPEDVNDISLDGWNNLLRIRSLKRQSVKERRTSLRKESRYETSHQGDGDFVVSNSHGKRMKKGAGAGGQDGLTRAARTNTFLNQANVLRPANFVSNGANTKRPKNFQRDAFFAASLLESNQFIQKHSANDDGDHVDFQSACSTLRQVYGDTVACTVQQRLRELGETNDQSGAAFVKRCQICSSDFNPSEPADAQHVMTNCPHGTACNTCALEYVRIRIRDGEVMPWIPCPDEKCKVPIHAKDICRIPGLTTLEIHKFLATLLSKYLSRSDNWVPCATTDCGFGFVCNESGPQKCQQCNKTQNIVRKGGSAHQANQTHTLDPVFQQMITDGSMRPCPKCAELTIKEFGICNVIECVKCGIWWNWRTRETGSVSADLKNKARAAGTLWENGELAYQLKLERENPDEFKRFLARNGIAYNPNYVRGHG